MMDTSDLDARWDNPEEVEKIWGQRRTNMANHRQQFESMWDSGISEFFKGILDGHGGDSNKMYDPIYEQYEQSMFSREGLRFSNIKYPMLHAITMRALASEMQNKAEKKWIAKGSNDQTKTIAFKHFFNQRLEEMDEDHEDFEVRMDRRIRGTAAVMVYTESHDIDVNEPVAVVEDEDKKKKAKKDASKDSEKTFVDEFKYNKRTINVREVSYRKIDLRNLYLDEHCKKSNLSDCMYAQVDVFMSEEEFRRDYPKLSPELLSKIVPEEDGSSESSGPFSSDHGTYIRVTYCFDKLRDRFHLLANGTLVNDVKTPIPRKATHRGKDIPIAITRQYPIPGSPYGYGDAHVTGNFSRIKDMVRLMILEITQKSAKKTLVLDPNSGFDESAFEWGQDVVRANPKEFGQLSMDADLGTLYKYDEAVDNDIIRATGVNINDTANIDSGETARKTVIRRESQIALIELITNHNSSTYYKRLYTLMKDDMILHYGAALKNGAKMSVRTKDVKIRRGKKGAIEDKIDGYGFFDMQHKDMEFEMDLMLEAGNLASSKELDKALAFEGLEKTQLAQEGFDPKGLARYIREVTGMPEYVLAKDEEDLKNMEPEALAKDGLDPQFLPESARLTPGGAPPEPPANPAPNAQVPNVPQGSPSPTPA